MAETLTLAPEVDVQSDAYIQEMAEKGSAAVNGGVEPEAPAVIPEKPEGIPDKFYNAETGVVDYTALAKSYVELEKSKGKQVEPPKADAKKPEGTTPPADAEVKAATDAVEAAGLDMPSLSQEFATNGELSEDSYAKLDKAGISKDLVDSFIEGQQAKAEVARGQAFSITEGQEGYTAMVAYAQANLTPAEIDAYNTAVNSPIPSVRELAVRGMWSRYSNESGNTGGNLITNKTNTKVGSDVYQSRAEMMSDMNDPKYKTDEAFRSKVSAKLGRSNVF
jgi:hypothetical protein